MARLFLYEYCTALGLGRDRNDPAHSLFREGAAMRNALLCDAEAAGHDVATLDDVLIDDEKQRFSELLQGCDFAIVIAPEFDELLLQRSRWVDDAGIPRLGPSLEAIERTSDKFELGQYWHRCNIPTPYTELLEQGQQRDFPQIVKARFGAGGLHTHWIAANAVLPKGLSDAIIQPWHDGIHASQAFLVGPRAIVPLPPAIQHLQFEPEFAYLGGTMPIEPVLAERVQALALRCVETLPGLSGYVGVDVVLTDANDWAIEINPRLTTSYLGYRALLQENVLQAWLNLMAGGIVSINVRFTPRSPGGHRYEHNFWTRQLGLAGAE